MPRLSLSAVTRRLGGMRPNRINQGYCFIWALLAAEAHPEAVLYSCRTYGGHAFIGLHGKFYDAQRPRGVLSWRSLPFFAHVPSTATGIVKAQRHKTFVKTWLREAGDKTARNTLVNMSRGHGPCRCSWEYVHDVDWKGSVKFRVETDDPCFIHPKARR